MNMKAEFNPTKRLLFNALGMGISILPVAVSIFSYFPLWMRRGNASVLSGVSLFLICLAAVPLFKYLKQIMHSPSAPVMWFIVFVIFLLLSRIADEMTVISFVGFTTNLIGAFFFKLARRYGKEQRDEGRT